MERGGGGGRNTYHASRITSIILKLSRVTKKENESLTTSTSIPLSFDLRKSHVEKREKRARSWCHKNVFDVSVSSSITEISKENHASRVVIIVNHASR